MTRSDTGGTVLRSRYQLERQLGRGDIALTWLAVDMQTNERCVIKELLFDRTLDPKALDLFEREARVLRNLDHPGIPRYIDSFEVASETGPHLFLVQAYANGPNLAQRMQQGRAFNEEDVLRIGLDVARIRRSSTVTSTRAM
jgi:serine/threonine protein kinase